MTPADTITAIGSLNHFCGLCTQNQKPITTQDTAKTTPFLGSISTFYFFFGGVAQHLDYLILFCNRQIPDELGKNRDSRRSKSFMRSNKPLLSAAVIKKCNMIIFSKPYLASCS